MKILYQIINNSQLISSFSRKWPLPSTGLFRYIMARVTYVFIPTICPQLSGTQGAPRSSSPKRTFGGTGPFSQITKGLGESQGGDMDELLQLCSGTFAK